MVRVGGGWDTLENYLNKHDPCRCNRHRAERHLKQVRLYLMIKGRIENVPIGRMLVPTLNSGVGVLI